MQARNTFGRTVAAGWLVGMAMLLAGCGGAEKPVAVAHPWIHPPEVIDPKAVTLPPFLVYRVDPSALAEARAELEKEPYIQISPSMASHFAKSDVTVPAEMRPFLIRGVDTGTSKIAVVQSMQGLWVKVTGGDLKHLDYQPLVVLVDPTPVDIYVTVEQAAPKPKG